MAGQTKVPFVGVSFCGNSTSVPVRASQIWEKKAAELNLDFNFLNRTEIKQSLLTYLVKVDIQRQPSVATKYNFNWEPSSSDSQGKYGDRFISNFIEGGALFARVSILTNEKSSLYELKQAAKVVFTAYGAKVELNDDMKAKIAMIQNTSEVKIYLYYAGTPVKVEAVDGAQNDLTRLKEIADSFSNNASTHKYKRFALLERYTNIFNFKDEFTPLDYEDAKTRSWTVFTDFVEYSAIQEMIRAIDSGNYTNGRSDRDRLDEKASTQLQEFRDWVKDVAKEPEKCKSLPPVPYPSEFQTEVLLALKTTKYIAQTIHLNNKKTHSVIDDHKHDNAEELFSFKAYDFGQALGTSKIIFGKNSEGDSYICMMGRESITAGYKQICELWGFEKKLEKLVDKKVGVYPIVGMGTIELELEDATPRKDDDYSFYVKT
ncbi:uncharacterized protein PGRI_065990 [Penicillium griseofulvum]|uniref:Uncharacterized protein n=1 Tax=Penicillium patulum TaxID=5078 RepID=A0A135LPY4_PENPA|nr:uncharacterized protein PGRI_065990 [Penicillium griseofulvum]KXG51027.1 hypothetical protein PGRI_065990 [Penicillium griseofulvum]